MQHCISYANEENIPPSTPTQTHLSTPRAMADSYASSPGLGISSPVFGFDGVEDRFEMDRPSSLIIGPAVGTRQNFRNSAIWASTTSDPDDPFVDSGRNMELNEQSRLLQEYNHLALKHGIRQLQFDDGPETLETLNEPESQGAEKRSWFARTFGKPPSANRRSSRQSGSSKSEKSSKHKRNDSDSDAQNAKKETKPAPDSLKNQTLETLVRLCGKSPLYLPGDYATSSLVLPTCLRAAAQYLVQNGPETRGVFRISGSMRVVNELYDYYCVNVDDGDISATVRSPNLPFHIKVGPHDVASMFKRLLAGLPGGILGHMSLFDALVSIHGKFNSSNFCGSDHETAHKRNARARLIALAIASVPSQLQRELICAVFGLLSLIGHAAETSIHEDTKGTERMGYTALGIIFGPILVGDLLGCYANGKTDDTSASPGIIPSLPVTPSPRSKSDKSDKRRKSIASEKRSSVVPLTLDKVLLANNVAEMLISQWQDVIHQMKRNGIMRKQSTASRQQSFRRQNSTLARSRSKTCADVSTISAAAYRTNWRKTLSSSEATSTSPPGSFISSFGTSQEAGSNAPGMPTSARKPVAQSVDVMAPTAEEAAPQTPIEEPRTPNEVGTAPRRVDEKLLALFEPQLMATMDSSSDSPGQKGNVPAPRWRKSLKPVDLSSEEMGGESPDTGSHFQHNQHPRPSIDKAPKRRSDRTTESHSSTYSGHSTPSGMTRPARTPQSKTAALIARIMNSRQSTSSDSAPAPTIPNKAADRASPSKSAGPLTKGSRFAGRFGISTNSSSGGEDFGSHGVQSQSPLTEIKNGARRPQSGVGAHSHFRNRLTKRPWEDSQKTSESNSTYADITNTSNISNAGTENGTESGSRSGRGAVKAMAAMFDNAARESSCGTPNSRHTPKAIGGPSPYGSNSVPPKVRDPFTPINNRRAAGTEDEKMTGVDGHGWTRSEMAEMDSVMDSTMGSTMGSAKKRIRLSRNEDKSASEWLQGRGLVTEERRDLTRSEESRGTGTAAAMADGIVGSRVRELAMERENNGRDGSKQSTMQTPTRTGQVSGTVQRLEEQIRDLQRRLEAKSAECQLWKQKAEQAQNGVSEMERLAVHAIDAAHDNRICKKCGGGELGLDGLGRMHGRNKVPKQSPAQIKETTPSMAGMVASYLRRSDSDTDDGGGSPNSSMTVVVHGRMGNERMLL